MSDELKAKKPRHRDWEMGSLSHSLSIRLIPQFTRDCAGKKTSFEEKGISIALIIHSLDGFNTSVLLAERIIPTGIMARSQVTLLRKLVIERKTSAMHVWDLSSNTLGKSVVSDELKAKKPRHRDWEMGSLSHSLSIRLIPQFTRDCAGKKPSFEEKGISIALIIHSLDGFNTSVLLAERIIPTGIMARSQVTLLRKLVIERKTSAMHVWDLYRSHYPFH